MSFRLWSPRPISFAQTMSVLSSIVPLPSGTESRSTASFRMTPA